MLGPTARALCTFSSKARTHTVTNAWGISAGNSLLNPCTRTHTHAHTCTFAEIYGFVCACILACPHTHACMEMYRWRLYTTPTHGSSGASTQQIMRSYTKKASKSPIKLVQACTQAPTRPAKRADLHGNGNAPASDLMHQTNVKHRLKHARTQTQTHTPLG